MVPELPASFGAPISVRRRSALLALTPLDEMPPAAEPGPVVAYEEAEESVTA
jgi:hypothetical protein